MKIIDQKNRAPFIFCFVLFFISCGPSMHKLPPKIDAEKINRAAVVNTGDSIAGQIKRIDKLLIFQRAGFSFEAIYSEKIFANKESMLKDFQQDIPQRPKWRKTKTIVEYLRTDYAIWLASGNSYANITFTLKNQDFRKLNRLEYEKINHQIDLIAEEFANTWQ